MKVVSYLSGRNMSQELHNTRDSIAASCEVPRKIERMVQEFFCHNGPDTVEGGYPCVTHSDFYDLAIDLGNWPDALVFWESAADYSNYVHLLT